MARVPVLMLIPVAVVAGLVGLAGFAMWQGQRNGLPSTFVGQTAPRLPEEAVRGTDLLTAEDLASGEITLVNFWASWCPPCRAEHPTLQQLADEGWRVAGVNFRDDPDDAASYLADYGDPFFATGFDRPGRVAIDWGVSAPPETFIVGPDGTVLNRFTGPLVGDDFEQRFLPMLEAAAGG